MILSFFSWFYDCKLKPAMFSRIWFYFSELVTVFWVNFSINWPKIFVVIFFDVKGRHWKLFLWVRASCFCTGAWPSIRGTWDFSGKCTRWHKFILDKNNSHRQNQLVYYIDQQNLQQSLAAELFFWTILVVWPEPVFLN